MDSASGDPAATFAAQRPRLFGIAYRMLGSVAEAEDAVQETFVRWYARQAEPIDSAEAYLTTILTRLCIDELRSARHRREQYVGLWLPEPLVERDERDPAAAAQLSDSLGTAFLLLLETLSPVERAVFLLREVFEYDFGEVAEMVGKTESNCRQMATRARNHLAARRPRFSASPEQAATLLEEFKRAAMGGDTDGLIGILTEDAAIYADGGGKAAAAGKPILGGNAVAKFLVNVTRLAPPNTRFETTTINAAPGILVYVGETLVQSMSFELAEGKIQSIYVVRNPDKLAHVGGRS